MCNRGRRHTCRRGRRTARRRLFRIATQIMPYGIGHTECSNSRFWRSGAGTTGDRGGLDGVCPASRSRVAPGARSCRTHSRGCRLSRGTDAFHVSEVREGRVEAGVAGQSDSAVLTRAFPSARCGHRSPSSVVTAGSAHALADSAGRYQLRVLAGGAPPRVVINDIGAGAICGGVAGQADEPGLTKFLQY